MSDYVFMHVEVGKSHIGVSIYPPERSKKDYVFYTLQHTSITRRYFKLVETGGSDRVDYKFMVNNRSWVIVKDVSVPYDSGTDAESENAYRLLKQLCDNTAPTSISHLRY